MVTKNPCLSAGDVRILKAIKRESLKHHVDVIVFPRNGPRPHPDEMGGRNGRGAHPKLLSNGLILGSDLDGDEYAVFWDNENLSLKRHEEALDFPKSVPEKLQDTITVIVYSNQTKPHVLFT